ncbi:response regulator [Aspergillus lucknowensis]|uniref:Response regulatory domain-containing protein n=1 Tax=Aspergillus lucknowensis TaxID=176173 RepID=A0ABR4LVH0_9EURO
MSERRWSARLKAKLLRRSSTSSKGHPFTTTTPNSSSSMTHDPTPQSPHYHTGQDNDGQEANHRKQAAEELSSADPNSAGAATTTTTPPISTTPNVLTSHPPPLSSASRPSVSSIAESQYTPDELASPTGSSGGQYFFVPEYRQPASCSSSRRQIEEPPPFNPSSSPTSTITGAQPQSPEHQQTSAPRQRFEASHNRDRNRSGSSRKSFPAELLHFPLPPSRKVEYVPAAPSSPPASNADRPSAPSSFTTRERHTSGPVEPSPSPGAPLHSVAETQPINTYQSFPLPPTSFSKRPSLGSRRQSLLPASYQHLVSSFLDTGSFSEPDGFGNKQFQNMGSGIGVRKIWVKRPGGSATLLPTSEDALVDELRDQVVTKYANSLGKTFDAPDIIIRIAAREGFTRQSTPDRILNPEEPLIPVLDSYYPGGQTVEEALVIEIPQRRTPKPSPRHNVYYTHSEPGEHGDYFPLMPANVNMATPPAHQSHMSNSASSTGTHPAPSISILTTGMAPTLPSPGGRSRHRRPPLTRHSTTSPTVVGQPANAKENGSQQIPVPTQPTPPVPSPPGPPPESPHAKSLTPPARGASPRPGPAKTKKASRPSLLNGAFGGLIEGTVPPINVLIVEDNVINQRLLEAFMKRLSVRWKCAANGEEAVKKWREGGFHLVLMDIQLPVMNGLDATKEIRRLERLNGIGVFPKKSSGRSSAANANSTSSDQLMVEDTLHDLSLFRSPVIIVALTASSLQSDRHEALAAGCNDFLTKPVRFEWLEQKVTEWGCMQALIDFEGWRKWRGFADDPHPDSDDYSSPTHRRTSVIRKSSHAAPSSSSHTKKAEVKARHLKRSGLAEDSPDSGDGSDSPASLHADHRQVVQHGPI